MHCLLDTWGCLGDIFLIGSILRTFIRLKAKGTGVSASNEETTADEDSNDLVKLARSQGMNTRLFQRTPSSKISLRVNDQRHGQTQIFIGMQSRKFSSKSH
jgi:hypothetical protein